jgi:hypothetical protein
MFRRSMLAVSSLFDLYTGLTSTGGTYADIVTGVTSSTATSYSDILQGGAS